MNWRAIFSDIRFWICIGFALRLITIDTPIFDSHNWRQADGYGIARNFLEEDANILYPRIDARGENLGITGSEFPLLNYLTYLIYLITGVQWFPGRLINLVVSSFGIYAFYRIIRDFIKVTYAKHAALILLASIWFGFSRKFMPDTFSASFVLFGIYFIWKFSSSKSKLSLILGALLISLGLLSKLSSFVLLAFLVPILFSKEFSLKLKSVIMMAGILALVPVLYWYFIWVPHLNSSFGLNVFFMGRSVSESLPQLLQRSNAVLKRFYQDAFYYLGFLLFILGLFKVKIEEKKELVICLLSSLLFTLLLIGKSGFNFAEHNYYIIPVVPFMAMIASLGFHWMQTQKIRVFIIIALVSECFMNQLNDVFLSKDRNHMVELKVLTDQLNENDLVVIASSLNPQSLYFVHKKGWAIPFSDVNQNYIQELKDKGARTLIWSSKKEILPESTHYSLIRKSQNWLVYELH